MDTQIIPGSFELDNRDADFRRRWPPHQYPALYLSEREYLALRRQERQRKEFLAFHGPDIADIALAVLEESK